MNIVLKIKKEELRKKLNIKDGDPGKDADETKILTEILKMIPPPVPTPPVDKEARQEIEELREEIKKLGTKITDTSPRQIYGPGKTKIITIDLSSQLNGVKTTFPLGITHFGIEGVYSSSAPFVFRPVIDFNDVGRNIVFTSSVDASVSLAGGQTLIVRVFK